MSKRFNQKLRQLQQQLPRVVKRFPGIAKVEGMKFIADNFKHEGFETSPGVYKKWKRKKKQGTRKPVLIGEKRGGSLRRGWQGAAHGMQAEFTNQKPYAEVHNEGLRAGRPPGFQMPERRMIGPSDALDERIKDKLDRVMEDLIM